MTEITWWVGLTVDRDGKVTRYINRGKGLEPVHKDTKEQTDEGLHPDSRPN